MTYATMGEARIASLLTMLTYKRPAGSKAEQAFVDRYLVPLGTVPDEYGNHWLTIGTAPILWSSHTDTVHKTAGSQKVIFGDNIATSNSGECLGADCAAGVWLMAEMIKAKVPGTYVFHREEEIGGKGSSYIALNTPERLSHIKFAIAFDRMGVTDIITHQYGGRTASDAFAASLAHALAPIKYRPCPEGIFTDTANYSGIIPECTNIAVGYVDHHRPNERLYVGFLCKLLNTILKADFTQLVCERDPVDDGFGPWADDDAGPWVDDPDTAITAPANLESYVYEHPGVVADFLAECGYDLADLHQYERRRRY